MEEKETVELPELDPGTAEMIQDHLDDYGGSYDEEIGVDGYTVVLRSSQHRVEFVRDGRIEASYSDWSQLQRDLKAQ